MYQKVARLPDPQMMDIVERRQMDDFLKDPAKMRLAQSAECRQTGHGYFLAVEASDVQNSWIDTQILPGLAADFPIGTDAEILCNKGHEKAS